MSFDVALVGLMLPEVENHALTALARAVEAAGLRAALVPFAGWPDLEDGIARVLRLDPRVCGISMQAGEAALAQMAFARILRQRGFRGRLVVGGHFATLNAEDILRAPAGIDAVVRFAGEAALVGLLRTSDPTELPGLVFRASDGTIQTGAPPVIDAPARRLFGEELPRHLGFPAADVVLSRGCEAHCAYCCVAAASAEAERHGARYVRPTVADIADELAWLWHERGARVVNFMDDNLLPLDANEAEAFLAALEVALRARRVGRFAFSLQFRADVATLPVLDRLRTLGLARAYVGIDGWSQPQLAALGRRTPAGAGVAALDGLASRDVFTVANALLLGPTISFETLCAEIEGLAAVRHAPVHLLPIDVRAGTAYAERAERRGLVEGGFLWRRFRYEDDRTGMVGDVLTSLPTRLYERSVPIALYDLAYNLGIARRLVPEADVASACATYARVTAAWNADQIRVLRVAAKAAARRDRAAIETLRASEGARVRPHDEALLAACDAALVEVEHAVARVRRGARAHTRGRLLSAVAFATGLAGCVESGGGPAPDASSHQPPGDAPHGDGAVDSGGGGSDATSCPGGRMLVSGAFEQCYSQQCKYMGNLVLTFDSSGIVIDIEPVADAGDIAPAVRDCLANYLGMYCYPSLAGTTQRVSSVCWIA